MYYVKEPNEQPTLSKVWRGVFIPWHGRSNIRMSYVESVSLLDEEDYHIGFRDQKWKVTKGSLVVARGKKRGSLYMVEVHPDGIGAIIDGSGSEALDCDAENSFRTPLQFGVAERLSQTFRAESTGLRAEALKIAQMGAQIRVRGPKTVRASRIVDDQMKNTLKTEHPARREALRLHRYEDLLESPGLQ
ncbi:hypothetical protein Tco_0952396 [Tanacetum coccineum]|uniref:Uncharacterized protein n=1 Tax=Tanacetum coccineum TaxID=301880 RepID=A0ABQ5DZQ3_9ASTR